MLTTVRHAFSVLAALAVLCALTLVGAAPAQAAVGVQLDTTDTTITLGESFDLSWTSTEAVTLTASGSWSGDKATPSGSQTITPGATGDFTYQLLATDENGREATDTVDVTVEPAAPAPISPAPVTFDGCEVTVPSTPNVTYFVDYGDGDVEELEADTYPAGYFDIGGDPVLFYAEANDGFQLDDEAVTDWEYTAPEDCLGESELVTATAGCHEVTFTSLVDVTIGVAYGDGDLPAPDGEFDLAAGDVHTIHTDRDVLYFEAYSGEFDFQSGELDVTADCAVDPADGSDHPTVAPAAGK
ncbi:hypothetical protein GCM10022234_13580 [Aeromicrobium panaciterrae]|uniref:hypothetical protein n=1 Tax=Aeromicrobium panaciterrae TaxID=363861 RepID=UPI0031E3F831